MLLRYLLFQSDYSQNSYASDFYESAILRSLSTLAPTRLTHHWYVPYPSLIYALRVWAPTRFYPSISALRAFVLFYMCALINHSPHFSLLSFILPYKAVLHVLFSFFYFKPLVTLLFIQLFSNKISRFSVLYFFWNKLNKHPIM